MAPTDAGFALELANVDGVIASDLAFEAQAGTPANRSSIAAFARGSKGKLLRVELIAHEGKDGSSATTGSNYDASLQPDDVKLAGHTGMTTAGGTQQDCPGLCTNNEHSTGDNDHSFTRIKGAEPVLKLLHERIPRSPCRTA